MTRCGIVTVVGAPNAGKSTLLNHLVGQHLAIVSPRPQSTRARVVGLVTSDHAQLILTDTPGLLDPKYHLHRAMQHEVQQGLDDADLVLFIVDASRADPPGPDALAHAGLTCRVPIVVALNKLDAIPEADGPALLARFPGAFPISARTGVGVRALLEHLAAQVPEGPFLYDAEAASSQSTRFFVTEAVREAAFEQLDDELPYAIHCEIDEFREDRRPVYIRATIYVERESQKRMVIGNAGSRIKELGRATRAKVEPLVDAPVYLDLWVKVLPNWRRNVAALQRLGFTMPQE